MNDIIGFLSPEGELIECEQFNHIQIASQITAERYFFKMGDPQVILANEGWCFLQKIFAGIPAEIDPKPKFTDQQIKWIMDNYDRLNHKQRYFISEKLKMDDVENNLHLPEEVRQIQYPGLV